MTHTPTPLQTNGQISYTRSIAILDSDRREVAGVFCSFQTSSNAATPVWSDADAVAFAAHIVRCVNAHDELVAALRVALEALGRYTGTTAEREIIRAALAKTEKEAL